MRGRRLGPATTHNRRAQVRRASREGQRAVRQRAQRRPWCPREAFSAIMCGGRRRGPDAGWGRRGLRADHIEADGLHVHHCASSRVGGLRGRVGFGCDHDHLSRHRRRHPSLRQDGHLRRGAGRLGPRCLTRQPLGRPERIRRLGQKRWAVLQVRRKPRRELRRVAGPEPLSVRRMKDVVVAADVAVGGPLQDHVEAVRGEVLVVFAKPEDRGGGHGWGGRDGRRGGQDVPQAPQVGGAIPRLKLGRVDHVHGQDPPVLCPITQGVEVKGLVVATIAPQNVRLAHRRLRGGGWRSGSGVKS